MLVSRFAFTQVSDERNWLRAEVARLQAEITRLTTAPAPVTSAELTPQEPPEPLPEIIRNALADVVRVGTEEHAKVARWAREQVRNKRNVEDVARAIREGED